MLDQQMQQRLIVVNWLWHEMAKKKNRFKFVDSIFDPNLFKSFQSVEKLIQI